MLNTALADYANQARIEYRFGNKDGRLLTLDQAFSKANSLRRYGFHPCSADINEVLLTNHAWVSGITDEKGSKVFGSFTAPFTPFLKSLPPFNGYRQAPEARAHETIMFALWCLLTSDKPSDLDDYVMVTERCRRELAQIEASTCLDQHP